ncbi:MAG: ester cyclase [Candidatus Sericytochromatia bacterium]
MSKNSAVLRQAHEAFSRGEHEQAAQLVAQQVEFVDHGRNMSASDREGFQGWLDSHKAMASQMKIVDAKYIDAGDYVTAQFRAVGVQDGPMMAFPATGKEFAVDVCEVWRFNAEGQAVEGHNYSDGLGLLFQLGHLAPPAA